jgi:glycosyltransferase involved in cell wall biosynthesis
MKLLFITPYLPSEKSGHAGAKLIYQNIISLSKLHQVSLATFIDSNEENMLSILANNGIDVHPVNYPRNQQSILGKLVSGFRNIVPVLSYLMGKEPFFFAKYNKKRMRSLISQLLSNNNFDLIQVEYNVMHHYSDLFVNIPSVLVFHDISTKLYERGKNLGIKTDRRLYNIAKKIEVGIANKFDSIVTLTEEDKLYLINLGYNKEICVIPPQINVVSNIDIPKKPNTICFVGSYNRQPNVRAVEVLINDIYNNIDFPVELNIVGKSLPKYLQKEIRNTEGINYLGFIDEIDEFIKTQMLMVAPIQLGAGLKMKIPHSLANGTPVITTPIGAEGIDISSENGLWVCDGIEMIIKKINALFGRQPILIGRGKAGQNAVKKLFSEEVILSRFDQLFSQLIKK